MRIVLPFIAFFIVNVCLCQNAFHISIDKTSGLPSNSVYDIFQDSKGFMWFATGKGLSRFDGNHFKTFTADFQTSKSGSCIAEDAFGRIWYANFDGFLYYVEQETIKALPQETSLGYYRFGIIKNDLFLIQPKAILVYDLKTLKVKFKHVIADKQIRACFSTKNNFYVLGEYLYEIGSKNSITQYPLPIDFYENIVSPLLNVWNDTLIINSKSKPVYYRFSGGKFIKSELKNAAEFTQNTSIIDNAIWICTPNGLFKNNLLSNQHQTYFTNKNVSYIFKDNHHNYWISTLDSGVLFIQDFSNNFIELSPRPISLALGKNAVFSGANKDLIYKINTTNLQTETIYESKSNHAVSHIFADTINDKIYFNSFKFKILNKKNTIDFEYDIAIKDIKKVDDKYFSFAASGILGLFFVDEKSKSSWDNIRGNTKYTLKIRSLNKKGLKKV